MRLSPSRSKGARGRGARKTGGEDSLLPGFPGPFRALESAKLEPPGSPVSAVKTYVVGFRRNPETAVSKGRIEALPSCRTTRPRTRGDL